MTDLSIYLVHHTSLIGLLSQNLLDSILQLRDQPTDQPQSVLPEDSLRSRLLFLSELLATAKGSADCKDVPDQSLLFYQTLIDALNDTVLKGFLAVELLSIKSLSLTTLTRRNTRIIFATRVLRLFIATLLPDPASPLLDLLLHFLFDQDASLLLASLLARINSNSSSLSIATFHLFNELLKSQHPVVMKALLPAGAASAVPCGQYYQAFCAVFAEPLPCMPQAKNLPPAVANCLSDVEHAAATVQVFKPVAAASTDVTDDVTDAASTDVTDDVTDGASTDVTDVVTDGASTDVTDARETTQGTPTKEEQTHTQGNTADSTPFLDVVLSRVRMMLRQSMEVNLEVTQIIATLALVTPAPLFCQLFLSSTPHSIAWELNTVCIVWWNES